MRAFIFYMVIALGAVGIGAYEYVRISELEQVSDTISFGRGRYNWLIAMFYDWAGKLGVVGFFALIAMGAAIEGVRRLMAGD